MTRMFLTALPLIFAQAALAQDGMQSGRALAEERCARCHDVAPGGADKLYPPSFASIAGFRPEEQIRSRILFPQLHTPMPAWADWLTPEQIDDLVAYILMLEDS